jgi:hypothetical protein
VKLSLGRQKVMKRELYSGSSIGCKDEMVAATQDCGWLWVLGVFVLNFEVLLPIKMNL